MGIRFLDSNNQKIYLVQGNHTNAFSLPNGIGSDIDGDGVKETPTSDIDNVQIGGVSISITSFPSGKLLGLIESFGYKDSLGNVKGIYPEMINNLDNLAYTFGTVFNAIHKEGYGLNSSAKAPAFFDESTLTVPGAAKNIKLSSAMDDLSNIAASTKQGVSGNGNNALNLASVGKILLSFGTVNLIDVSISLPTSLPLTSGTIQSNYQGWIGKLGVDGQQAERLKNNSEVLRQSVEERRQSVSSVSLDEEMTNMIKFQHAYNAAARQITAIDEMLDKIINGMGIVGR